MSRSTERQQSSLQLVSKDNLLQVQQWSIWIDHAAPAVVLSVDSPKGIQWHQDELLLLNVQLKKKE